MARCPRCESLFHVKCATGKGQSKADGGGAGSSGLKWWADQVDIGEKFACLQVGRSFLSRTSRSRMSDVRFVCHISERYAEACLHEAIQGVELSGPFTSGRDNPYWVANVPRVKESIVIPVAVVQASNCPQSLHYVLHRAVRSLQVVSAFQDTRGHERDR